MAIQLLRIHFSVAVAYRRRCRHRIVVRMALLVLVLMRYHHDGIHRSVLLSFICGARRLAFALTSALTLFFFLLRFSLFKIFLCALVECFSIGAFFFYSPRVKLFSVLYYLLSASRSVFVR